MRKQAQKLVVGCGYLGHRVAERWLAAGDTVFAVTRSSQRASQFQRAGLAPIVADVRDPRSLAGRLPTADTVLWAVGFDARAGGSIEQVYVEGLRNVLGALPAETRRIVYISSTGVYGDAAGQWIDEDTPCRPRRAGGIASLAAEGVLAEHPLGPRSVVLRLAGLYGPGRVPRLDALRAGEPIPAPECGFLNLIHVLDAVEVVLAAERDAPPPRTYLVSDGQPVVRREYYEALARLVGAPPPRFAAPAADSPAAERAASDKRISNARMRAELRVELKYPSFREGLAQIVAERDAAAER